MRKRRQRLMSANFILRPPLLQQPNTASSAALIADLPSINSPLGIYSAFYEFAQFSSPITIWERGSLNGVDHERFKLFVVSTPTNSVSQRFNYSPVTCISSFESVTYLSIHFQVFDIEARGFSRSVVLVFAHERSSVISNLRVLYGKQLISIVKKIQKPSLERFPTDLLNFAKSLKLLQEKDQDNSVLLNSKMNELSFILKEFHIKDVTSDGAKEVSIQRFTSINNDLVPMREITHFDEIVPDINKFISSVPYSSLSVKLSSDLEFYESKHNMDFGKTADFLKRHNFSFFVNDIIELESITDEYEAPKCSILRLVKNNVFYFIAFALLSGQSLIIKSSNKTTGHTLAKRLSILCPFFHDYDLKVCDEIDPFDAKKYSIVVASKINGDCRNIVNLIDIDRGFYVGDGCLPNSYVNNVLGKCSKVSETSFVIDLLCKLKSTSTDFVIKLSRIRSHQSTQSALLSSLKEIGFEEDDYPILNYWTHSYFNTTKIRPILANNRSKIGLVFVPF